MIVIHDGIHVVRDDMIPGGTKRRFVDGFVTGPQEEFVYATPAYGGAQIALAIATRAAGKRCTIFVAKRGALHPRTIEAQRAGAKIMEIPYGYLSNITGKARAYCAQSGAFMIPHGFDTLDARSQLAAAALTVRRTHGIFDEVWCVAGSGTLMRSIQQAALGRRYVAVAVRRKTPNVGAAAELIIHPQEFGCDARMPPPFPSCSNYDAKAWQHLKARHGSPPRCRVLFWNVMG